MAYTATAIILLGPPGSGKTTIAGEISSRLGAAMIETGQLLRREIKRKTPLGKRLTPFLERGKLAPSELVTEVITEEIKQINEEVLIFDGFPRREDEIESFFHISTREKINLAAAVVFQLPRSLAVKRLAGRRVCPKCHAIYNIYFDPPERDHICDRCGVPLDQRKDDTKELVNKRLQVYEQQTIPVIEYFRTHYPRCTYELSAEDTMEKNVNAIISVLAETGVNYNKQRG